SISEIKSLSNNDNIRGYISDLSDFNSIQKMIDEISSDFSKLDVLINNAGVYNSPKQLTNDHLDMRFAVNYFAPYQLTNGLLPFLEKSSAPRVINLSSAAQSMVSIDALLGKTLITEQNAYAQSKLALTMWSFYLSNKEKNLNVIAVNPGSLLNTKMVQQAFGQHWSSADKGAVILHKLALSEEFKNSSGKYFDNDKGDFNNAHADAYNQEKINELITATKALLKT
ncbi:MAG: SDR family NAD(P)-dependent oxidoreductase, partial [Bacteroidota bacterium]